MSQFLTYLPQFEGILPKWLVFVSTAQNYHWIQYPSLTLPRCPLSPHLIACKLTARPNIPRTSTAMVRCQLLRSLAASSAPGHFCPLSFV